MTGRNPSQNQQSIPTHDAGIGPALPWHGLKEGLHTVEIQNLRRPIDIPQPAHFLKQGVARGHHILKPVRSLISLAAFGDNRSREPVRKPQPGQTARQAVVEERTGRKGETEFDQAPVRGWIPDVQPPPPDHPLGVIPLIHAPEKPQALVEGIGVRAVLEVMSPFAGAAVEIVGGDSAFRYGRVVIENNDPPAGPVDGPPQDPRHPGAEGP